LKETPLGRHPLEEPALGTAVPDTASLRSAVGIHRRFVSDILSVEVLGDPRALVQPRIISADIGYAILA